MLRELNQIKEPVPVHLHRQCVMRIFYAASHNLPEIGVQMTYCNMETEEIKRFQSGYIFEDLERWFYELIESMKSGRDIRFSGRKREISRSRMGISICIQRRAEEPGNISISDDT